MLLDDYSQYGHIVTVVLYMGSGIPPYNHGGRKRVKKYT